MPGTDSQPDAHGSGAPGAGADPAAAARALLTDSFGRIRDQVAGLCNGLTTEEASWRPEREANSIGWLLWHLARVQDDHIADAAGTAQVWTTPESGRSWSERFGLPFDAGETGFGQSPEEVGRVRVDGPLLDAYQADVHAATMRYVGSLTTDELERVVDRSWDPPVTAAVRLVSVIGDCTAHLGQAQYVLGMQQRL